MRPLGLGRAVELPQGELETPVPGLFDAAEVVGFWTPGRIVTRVILEASDRVAVIAPGKRVAVLFDHPDDLDEARLFT